MNELTLKDYSLYLPYELNFIIDMKAMDKRYPDEQRIKVLTPECMELAIQHGKPMMRRLSSLTKEIEKIYLETDCRNINNRSDILYQVNLFSSHGLEWDTPVGLVQFAVKNHYWIGDQSYFDKGLIINLETIKTE